ncbi:MAG: hypothetical protein RM049_20645 [Nostoc sp. DedQUE04]|uniref:hypothetical protein n=1 Tax=Nostoc sp. DedQUE04 TaxID=3075390 RepID=UPI002AD2D073|nr:hypothetical protein [Nostoc sp. DedQUE04]MDZ8137680.1 hypothetical protein [Nostoc sp. DedQUE04]
MTLNLIGVINMRNLSRLLQDIKDNPVMYLNKPSITCLDSFLVGYLSTRSEMGLEREGSGIEGFQDWIQEREKTNISQSWAGILLFFGGSERSAFSNFFELFEIFLKRNESSPNKENGKSLNSSGNDLRFSVRALYELLDSIKKRPGMYLGTSSITKLDMLLRGYSLAQREVGVPLTEQEREFEGFQSWVQEKYGIKSGQSWSKIILFYSVDEHEALQKFFELFEEYLNRNKSKSLEVDENSG